MPEPLIKSGSPYLASPARTLYDVCREAGRYDEGRACDTCIVQDICVDDRKRAERRKAAKVGPVSA